MKTVTVTASKIHEEKEEPVPLKTAWRSRRPQADRYKKKKDPMKSDERKKQYGSLHAETAQEEEPVNE